MYARVQSFHHPVEKLDELLILAREQVAAAPRPPGFKNFEYLIDRDNGKALLISFWETEEDVRHLEATNASTRAQVEAGSGVEPPPAEVFEVAHQAR